MATSSSRYTIPGSERAPLPGARSVGAVTPQERIEVSVRVRAKPGAKEPDEALGDTPLAARRYLSREEWAAAHGADTQDLAKVAAFAHAHGLVVVDSNAPRRTVVLSGTATQMEAAFGVKLEQFEHDAGTYRGRSGTISVPGDPAGIVEGVFGLDNRPQAKPHFQVLESSEGAVATRAASASFTPPQLATLYSFPTGVDGGRNAPTTANSADGEVMLDIEVAAGIAPKATIAVYFAPNTGKGFLDAITTAVHDATNKPSVISISWGGPESTWTPQAMTQYDQAIRAAASMGVTVCCAAGDNGSGDGLTDGKVHVDFPASSPNALGCGGTRLTASGHAIANESVWNDDPKTSATGGGVSTFFPLPTYQKSANVPPASGSTKTGRGVPDVAGNADPNSGYQVRVDGKNMIIGGTSAVAPLWAGLIALMNQKLGKPVGYLNPLLYGSLAGKGVFNDIREGNNGSYAARAGWDPCTGWGSPIGTKLLQALSGGAPPA